MQIASTLYPYSQSILTKIIAIDGAETSSESSTEDKNLHPIVSSLDTDAQRIVSLLTTNQISMRSAKIICRLVKLFNSNTNDYLYFKRSCKTLSVAPFGQLEHSMIMAPLGSQDKTRSVFISTHNHLDLPSSQKITFKSSIRLKFDRSGCLAASKNAAKHIIKMSVSLKDLDESALFAFKKRISIMQKLRNSCHFPKNYAFIYKSESQTFSIYQEKAISDLFTRNEKDEGLFALSETKKRSFTRVILGAIQDMKDAGVIHRDLKLENILYFGEDDNHIFVKVTDLGHACLDSDTYSLTQIPGSLPWVAPDIARKAFNISSEKPNLGNKADMWPIGLIIYYMATGMPAPHQIPLFDILRNEVDLAQALHASKMYHEIKQNPSHPHKESFFQTISEKNPKKILSFLTQKIRDLLKKKEELLNFWSNQISTCKKAPKQISTLKDLSIAMLQENAEDRISIEEALQVSRLLK